MVWSNFTLYNWTEPWVLIGHFIIFVIFKKRNRNIVATAQSLLCTCFHMNTIKIEIEIGEWKKQK